MQPRFFYAGLALVICLLIVIALSPRTRQDVAVLERLTPRIERAQMLDPQTRAAVLQLVERVRETAGDHRYETAGDHRYHERRELAIQRVTDALNAKEGLANVGQGTPELAPTLTSSP